MNLHPTSDSTIHEKFWISINSSIIFLFFALVIFLLLFCFGVTCVCSLCWPQDLLFHPFSRFKIILKKSKIKMKKNMFQTKSLLYQENFFLVNIKKTWSKNDLLLGRLIATWLIWKFPSLPSPSEDTWHLYQSGKHKEFFEKWKKNLEWIFFFTSKSQVKLEKKKSFLFATMEIQMS